MAEVSEGVGRPKGLGEITYFTLNDGSPVKKIREVTKSAYLVNVIEMTVLDRKDKK